VSQEIPVRVKLRPSGDSFDHCVVRSLIVVLTSVSFFAISVAASAQRYVSFDPPGSIQTYVSSINKSGQVVGGYRDSSSNHSFLRNTDGSIVVFDPPGANYSTATSINSSGEIVGYWYGSFAGYQGYYRDAAGNFTTFFIPTTGEYWTFPYSINDAGSIVGYGKTGSAIYDEGFVRDPGGTITVIDAPGAIETFAESINQSGFITGAYYDSASLGHGYILSPSGIYTILDVPGASGQGTVGAAINDRGQVAGIYADGKFLYGYLRSAGGAYTTFHISGAPTAATETGAINDVGQVAGIEQKISGLDTGFIRDNSGNITLFQFPGAGVAAEEDQGTAAVAINASGTVTGYYYDTSKVPHGFIRY
jgi:hypothetical protein